MNERKSTGYIIAIIAVTMVFTGLLAVGTIAIIWGITNINKKDVAANDPDSVVMRVNYIDGCIEGGGEANRQYCGCTYDKLAENFSTNQIMQAGIDSEMSSDMMDLAIKPCLEHYKQ